MQHNILSFFAYLNFESTNLNNLWAKEAAMRRRGVFSKMFVLRSMGNKLVPSPLNVYGCFSAFFYTGEQIS